VTPGVLQVRQVLFQETGRVQLKPPIRPGPAPGGQHATRDMLRVDCDLKPRPMKDQDNVILCSSNGYRFGLGPSALPAAPVASATAASSPTGDWFVSVTLDDAATQAFTRFTRQLSQFQAPLDQAAIVINGTVVTAPAVSETITGGVLQITGPFSEEEARSLADSLGA
jgi:preprotein translocase subunit SecD